MKIERLSILYVIALLAVFAFVVLWPIGVEAHTLRRFEVIGDGPQAVARYPAQPKYGLAVLGPGRYGVVAEKCEVEFFGLGCYSPAAGGQRQVIAYWPTQHWHFYRELAPGEPWAEGLGE